VTRVIPKKLKLVIFIFTAALAFFLIFSLKTPEERKQEQAIFSGEDTPRLVRKAIANYQQITTQLFSPVIEAKPSLPIVRFAGEKPYYEDDE
jgi:hypothetical protein